MKRFTSATFTAVLAVSALVAASCSAPPQPTVVRTEVPLSDVCAEATGPAVPPDQVVVNRRASKLIAPRPYDPAVAYPLVVSLHPFSVDASGWEAYSGLGSAASERGYWVLSPNGSEPGPRWSVPGGLDTGYDDIAWIDKLLVEVAATVCVDAQRIYAAGFSAGAAMAVGLSCELPWRFAAVAASGGSNLTTTCPSIDGVDALILHGSADPIAPLTGSTVVFAPPLGLSVAEAVASFELRNGCDGSVTERVSATTTRDVYVCDNRLEYWKMSGAGHTWAGSSGLLDLFVGRTDESISATTAVIDFFDAGPVDWVS